MNRFYIPLPIVAVPLLILASACGQPATSPPDSELPGSSGPCPSWYPDTDADGYGAEGSTPVQSCTQPDHHVANSSDCLDTDQAISPAALEVCDAVDNDCDTQIDEDITTKSYPDDDGDGFGTGDLWTCKTGPGFSSSNQDCDDTNPNIYPAAPDPAGDGLDLSCDGDDGLAPSVGTATSAYSSIQAALDAATTGQTVWVGPGTYLEYSLSMKGKALTLASTFGPSVTIVDAQGRGQVLVFNTAEGPDSVARGFTLTGGKTTSGAGLWCKSSSPTLENLILTGNTASDFGGGFLFQGGAPLLRNSLIHGNEATNGAGGALGGWTEPLLEGIRFEGNTASWAGGALFLTATRLLLLDVSGFSNSAVNGGGLYMEGGELELQGGSWKNNRAEADGGGGAFYFYNVSPLLSHLEIAYNAAYSGGGLFLNQANPSLRYLQVTGNQASYSGGAISLKNASPLLSQTILVGNTATSSGGGLFLFQSSPTLRNSILAYNSASFGGNLFHISEEAGPSEVKLEYSLVYSPQGTAADSLAPAGAALTAEPAFLAYTDTTSGLTCAPGTSLTCQPTDLHLSLGSPLINAGDPAQLDADGSRSDLGCFGGPAGGEWDADGDGSPAYFWPGAWNEGPAEVPALDFDCNDEDPAVQRCS